MPPTCAGSTPESRPRSLEKRVSRGTSSSLAYDCRKTVGLDTHATIVEVVTSTRVDDGTTSVRAHSPSRIDRAYDHHNVLYKAQYSMCIDKFAWRIKFAQRVVGPKQRGPWKRDLTGLSTTAWKTCYRQGCAPHAANSSTSDYERGHALGAFSDEASEGWLWRADAAEFIT